MKQKNFLFIFLLFFSLIPFSFAGPVLVQNFNDYDLGSSNKIDVYIGTMFYGFDRIVLNYDDGGSVVLTKDVGGIMYDSCYDNNINVCLDPVGSSIFLHIISNAEDFSTNITIFAQNVTTGYSNWSVNDTFSVTTEEGSSSDSPSSDSIDLGSSNSILGLFTNILNGLFPSSSSLSASSKFGFVFLSIFLVDLLIILFMLKRNGDFSLPFVFLLIFIDVSMTFYFMSIGYIPLSVLVITALLLVAIAYFKFKGGDS